ncbi:nodulin homeobox isoform X2 [Hordeum vulgare subsp. vulgare]|uniref:nodulin homeobox isoform X2 n=1 Tax=Hordeum vulgare subsp. vulgare TaxID=112509 RepID=UPI001D1A39A0|nr:nodulin homeobox isoform X2 [Hordeum vulgare subsp. vulgare]
MIDMVSAVQELSGLTTRELSDMLKESDSFVLRSKPEGGGPEQVDMEKLVSSLPLHLLAASLDAGRGSDLTYVLRGVRFLHCLSELATRHTKLEQVLLDDVKLAEQVMDLIFFVLSILSHWKKEDHLGASPFIHSSLVAASLHLMTSYFSSQWHELVHILLTHPKVDIFMDVAFDSLHEDTRLLSVRLSTLGTKAFPELCRNGGILSLSFTILKLGVPEWLKGSTDIASSISRQKAKILSILLQLCESESISYLDEVATLPKSMQLGLEVLDLLKTAFGRKQKPAAGSHDKSYPMGSVLISALRLVDVFSDDSNFRSSFITNTIPFLTQILATPHDEFVSSWCSVDLPVLEDDANLDYDPFGAADLALLAASNMLTEAKVNYSCNFRSISMPSIQYAQTRTSCVVKIIANLHVFVPNICEEQERDLFLQKFQKYLLPESPKPSLDHPAADEVTIVCTNLGSLSHYAKSLIPGNLLNEEDVQLLSDFAYKLQRWCKSQVGQRISQVAKGDVTSEMKVDLQPVQQPQATRASVPDPNMDGPPKDVQNIEESMATPPMKQDGNARDETPRNRASINGGLLQNSVGQNLIHLGVARTTSAGYPGASTATSMEVPRCRSVDHFKTPEPTKESFRDEDERQPSRRGKKRTIMNDGQVNEIENALVDEPEMHKNAASLQTWAEKLSGQGAEITSSQLKNWLNNRKAKLARIAKERGVPYEGEGADKSSTPATSQLGDSSESAGEESYLPPSRVLNALGLSNSKGSSRLLTPDSSEPSTQDMTTSRPFTRSLSFEPGRPVLLIDNEGNEVGRGEIFQVEGRAQGKSLAESHICIVDVTELKVEKWSELPHPSEASGRTFLEAESRHGGVMRVAWDVVRLAPVAM